MEWNGKKVFVTGATGLLGSWLSRQLLESGAEVVALVRDQIPKSEFFQSKTAEKCAIVRGDLTDSHLIERALNEYEIDTVFHLGAQTIVSIANRSPLSTFKSNVEGTWNVMEAARNSKLVERIVVASSDKAYGIQEKLPYTEESSLKGTHPYDVSKSCADLIAQAYYHTYGMPVAVTRCGNIFGGGDLNFNRIIPGTIKSALQNENPLIKSSGNYIRDYFYVKDAANSYIVLAENLHRPEVKGQAFNFSPGKPMSVVEIVDETLKACGKEGLKPKILNEPSKEIPEQYLNSTKAKMILKWKPRYQLHEALKETIEWYKGYFSKN